MTVHFVKGSIFRSKVAVLALTLAISVGLACSHANAATQKAAAKAKPQQELVISANPVLLMDLASGNVLYHKDANRKWYPASLTKLMTAYVTFRAIAAGEIDEDSVLSISKHALSYPPSKMGFAVGTNLTVGNALKMVLVKSANDIAAALAERVGGSEPAFVERMNAEAARLGLAATHFVNANGLFAAGQTTSARDMGMLTRQILIEFPHHSTLFQIPALRFGKKVLRSYNHLLERFSGADGMKTGFVCASGYNMVASATRSGRQLVAVVLGAENSQLRTETAAYLLSQGFERKDMMGAVGVPIANISSFGAMEPPFDMRPQVCPNGRVKWAPQVNYRTSYLEPRFKLMEPVRVYSGISKQAKPIILPLNLAQLPLQAPLEKPVLPLKQQAGKVVRLGYLPRPKP